MACFLITCESMDEREILRLHETIRDTFAFARCLPSAWIVDTKLGIAEICQKVDPGNDSSDAILVVELTGSFAVSGRLRGEVWEWLDKRLTNQT